MAMPEAWWKALNFDSRDSAYWAVKYSDVKMAHERSSDAREEWTRVRRARGARRHRPKNWEETMPRKIVKWVHSKMSEIGKDLYCSDNWRCAAVRSSSQMRRYQRQRARGCCGFYDKKFVGPDGNEYLIGCNYGH